jgi:hypothetical protein
MNRPHDGEPLVRTVAERYHPILSAMQNRSWELIRNRQVWKFAERQPIHLHSEDQHCIPAEIRKIPFRDELTLLVFD